MAKKKRYTVEEIDTHLARWQSRLKRAVNTIERLQRMRKRAVAIPKPKQRPASLAETLLNEMAAEGAAESVERPAAPSTQVPAAPDLAIPDFLRRSKLDPASEQLQAELAEQKRRKTAGRIAKMKAKASGETRKMPLTGKAALAAIRG